MASWNEGNLKDIHIALNEAFQDHWGHVDQTYEQFLAGTQGSATFAPDLSFLVMDGDIIAGVSLNRVLYYENERTGIQEGWIGSLGVRRAWRNQGIASALLNASMLAFQKSELSYAGLSVDTENLTGALRLYEKQGFAPVNISYTYMKQINLHK
jgi:ribosomal protein S18 acetylase RimI-like enzyme